MTVRLCTTCDTVVKYGVAHYCPKASAAPASQPDTAATATEAEPPADITLRSDIAATVPAELLQDTPPDVWAMLRADMAAGVDELLANPADPVPPWLTPAALPAEVIADLKAQFARHDPTRLLHMPIVTSDHLPPDTILAVSPPPPGEPFEVRKHAAYLVVSDDALMDAGVIPDTRPPAPPPSWRTRLRWRWWKWRERAGRAVGTWIAGVDLREDDE